MSKGAVKNVYIHFPFCLKRCSYCSFNITTEGSGIWRENFVDCIRRRYKAYGGGDKLDSLYVGGGTPSLATEQELGEIMSIFSFEEDCERTIESNPSERSKLSSFKRLFNRLSLGVQCLDDKVLKNFGRTHTSSDALKSIEDAVSHFDNVTCDVITCIPKAWKSDRNLSKELEILASFGIKHISVYELTVEKGTSLQRDISNGVIQMPCEDEKADQVFVCSSSFSFFSLATVH